MSEIEKMYKLANVQPQYKKRIECKEGYQVGQPCGKCPCIDCDKSIFEDVMPPFTAGKQIELIKLLGSVRDYTVEIDKFKGVYYVGCRSAGSNDKLWGSSNVFEDALAELINETWYCLTSEEKQQVKGILE